MANKESQPAPQPNLTTNGRNGAKAVYKDIAAGYNGPDKTTSPPVSPPASIPIGSAKPTSSPSPPPKK